MNQGHNTSVCSQRKEITCATKSVTPILCQKGQFTRSKKDQNPARPSTGGWMNKMCSSHRISFGYRRNKVPLHAKHGELLKHAAKWKKPRKVMYHMSPLLQNVQNWYSCRSIMWMICCWGRWGTRGWEV